MISYTGEKEQQTRVFEAILSSSPDPSFTFDLNGKFTYANKAFLKLHQRSLDAIIGHTHTDLNLPDGVNLQNQVRHVISTDSQYGGEVIYASSTGQTEVYDYILVPTHDNDGAVEAVAGTARNVTERKASEEENWRKANYDILTNLPNRRLFLDRLTEDLKQADRAGAQVALLFIDLDRFKEANDNYGHDAGDILLRRVAERIRAHVRETDTVARLGGDEFVIILHNIGDVETIKHTADKILKDIAVPFKISTRHIDISSSIGVAIFPDHAVKPDDLMKSADQAMYAAKTAGRNRLSFFQ